MALPKWTYAVHDLLTNAKIGELPLSGVKYNEVLNDSGQLSGQFVVDSRANSRRRVKDPYDATTPCRRCVYVYRDEVPQWGGIIWTRRYDSASRTVQIGCGDWWSYFDHRKVLPLLTPPVDVEFEIANLLVTQTGVDQNAIARYLVTLAQSHTGGDLGLVFDNPTSTSGVVRDRTWPGFELADVGEQLRQLANILGGPDVAFDVSLDSDQLPTRLMRIGTPRLGQQGAPWVWEVGGNVTDYTWPSDGTRYAKRMFATGKGDELGMPIAMAEDTTRPTWPLMETDVGYSTVSTPSVLQAHADSDQVVSRLPVVLPTLTVRGDRVPRIGEWAVGDDGLVRILDDFMPNGIETSMRIVRADITASDADQDESVTFTMAPLLDDVA